MQVYTSKTGGNGPLSAFPPVKDYGILTINYQRMVFTVSSMPFS